MTCVANDGKSFIIDGKRIKSVNQYANKENARLQSIADKQKLKSTKRLSKLWDKRNNILNDYILKSCRWVVEFCKQNDIGNIVLGFNKDMTRNVSLGNKNNQKIAALPMGKIKGTLINADINGALNILRKSKVVGLSALYSRGVVDTPKRIRLT